MGLVPAAAEEGDVPFGCQPQEGGEELLLPGDLGSIAPGELLPGQPSPPPFLQEGCAGAQVLLPPVHPVAGDPPGPFAHHRRAQAVLGGWEVIDVLGPDGQGPLLCLSGPEG